MICSRSNLVQFSIFAPSKQPSEFTIFNFFEVSDQDFKRLHQNVLLAKKLFYLDEFRETSSYVKPYCLTVPSSWPYSKQG